MFIGYYNLANFITLTGLASSVIACFMAIGGNIQIAIMLLMLSGICDCFDGQVARMKKDRSPSEKIFGVQIDTVSDMVSFGVTPAVILFCAGRYNIIPVFGNGKLWFICTSLILMLYIICAGIRLAYFNTLALTQKEEPKEKIFVGLPVPFSAIVYPVLFLLSATLPIPPCVSAVVLVAVYFITALAFIGNFKMKKPSGLVYLMYPLYEIILVVFYVIWGGRLNA